ncbi:hypothetical protein C0Q70_01686 [Pomacea canaliculata]|uniref:Uncharacterized protein n=1 Tax=Pomacea canaliculata TaxID=400727 RepID=A0A2T7Q061_POMCA|nr:hypothetical protein C0Q70_01686 [Pomacea canaliculata]
MCCLCITKTFNAPSFIVSVCEREREFVFGREDPFTCLSAHFEPALTSQARGLSVGGIPVVCLAVVQNHMCQKAKHVRYRCPRNIQTP